MIDCEATAGNLYNHGLSDSMKSFPKLNDQQRCAAARLFSPALFRELARYGFSPIFSRLANELHLLSFVSSHEPIRSIFDPIFPQLQSKNCRNEYVYKSAVARKLLLGRHSLKTAVLLNEFRVRECKADIAIINSTSNVFEIKSERDSLCRLEKQVAAYQTVFAKVNVITGRNHLDSALRLMPESVGVLFLNDRNQISVRREAESLTRNIQAECIFDSIRLSEAKAILENLGNVIPKVPNTRCYRTFKSYFKKLDKDIAHDEMVRVLRKTRSQSPLADVLESLPASIVPLALCSRLGRRDLKRLRGALDTPLADAAAWR